MFNIMNRYLEEQASGNNNYADINAAKMDA